MESKTIIDQLPLVFRAELLALEGYFVLFLFFFWFIRLWQEILEKARSEKFGLLWGALCLVVGAAISGFLINEMGVAYVPLACGLGLTIGLFCFEPSASVCLFISLMFLRPWDLVAGYAGLEALPKLSFAMGVAGYLHHFARRKEKKIYWTETTTFLVLFAVWAYITTVKREDMMSVQSMYFDTYFKIILLYFLILNTISSKRILDLIRDTILYVIVSISLISIYLTNASQKYVPPPPGQEIVRLEGFGDFGNSNDIAALVVLVIPFAIRGMISKESNLFVKLLSAFGLSVLMYCILLSQSRGASIAFGLMFWIAIQFVYKKKKLGIAVLVLGFVAGMLFSQFNKRAEGDLEGSSKSRKNYVIVGMKMAAKNPILGVGWQGYPANYERYTTDFNEWGYRTAHNSWILALSETGVLGLFLFFGVFLSSALKSFYFLHEFPEYFLSLVGYGLTITFLSHTYLMYPYLLFALIGVAGRFSKRKTEKALTVKQFFTKLSSMKTVFQRTQKEV